MKIVLGIIGLVILGYLIFGGGSSDSEVTTTSGENVEIPMAGELIAVDQKAGEILLVQSVTLLTDGYVVAHATIDGAISTDTIGASVLLPAGTSLNIGVPLDEGISLTGGESIYFMLHDDNGDGEYLFPGENADLPTINEEGRITVALINILGGGVAGDTSEVLEKETTDKGPALISYDENGFSPALITVNVGDTVVFENEGTKKMWVASTIHPTHKDLPGFDQLKSVDGGGNYSYTFEKAGTWKYHNHLQPNNLGTIIVK